MNETFGQTVYRILARVPEGSVISYGQLAMLAGKPRAARLVGQLMSRAKGGDLPYHRVVRSDGSVSEAFSADVPGLQRMLLRSEGVSFRSDGRIDMAVCQWHGITDDRHAR